jgi:hypothetical protein
MIASQNAQEAIQAYEKADKTADPNATRVIYVKLAHAILSQNNEITEEEVAKIPFQALLKIAGMMSERVGQPFLEEVSPSTPAKKPKSVKKAK